MAYSWPRRQDMELRGERRAEDRMFSWIGIKSGLLGLLEEYDGEGILIATTNLEDILDTALFRRFDELIELPKPSKEEIASLLEMSFSALRLNKGIDISTYATKMIGLSYAIVVKIANDAAKKSVIRFQDEISSDDLDKALEENIVLNK